MKLLNKLIAGLALVGAAGSVHALPITDIYTPPTQVLLFTDVAYHFQHDLLVHGFNPLVDTLTNATLTLAISGNNGHNLTIELDASSTGTKTLNVWNLAAGLAVNLAYLQNDGILNVSLTKDSGGGAFSFLSSTLFVDGRTEQPPPSNVPEPAMLTLLGLGLVGTRLAVRRRTTKA